MHAATFRVGGPAGQPRPRAAVKGSLQASAQDLGEDGTTPATLSGGHGRSAP